MDGTPGHFWTDLAGVLEVESSNDGYVRLVDNLFRIETLRTKQYMDEFGNEHAHMPSPTVVYALTGATASIFFDWAGISQNNVLGLKASTQTIRTRGLVTQVPLDELTDGRFTRVDLQIPQVTRWSGLVGVSEKIQRDSAGRTTAWEAKTRDFEPLEVPISRNHKLVLSTTWSVSGPTDRRVLSTPLLVGSVSTKPLAWREHLRTLAAVQDLINVAYEGFVPAEQATVQFRYTDEDNVRPTPQMWNSRLMTVPSGVNKPKSMTEFPKFYLSHIGGARGLRNWIRLDRQHSRATGPITSRYRYGTNGVEVRLIEIALGIEYWTAAHRRTAQWTRPTERGESLPKALARYVGPSFAEFVGDLDKWSDKFWRAYTSLKHAPSFEYDPSDVLALGDSGALLLEGALLNRIAGNKQVMKAICESHRMYSLKQHIREVVNR